jgi:hypothetical protein
MGRTIPTSCNQCGSTDAMIAIPRADVCGPLQIEVGKAYVVEHSAKPVTQEHIRIAAPERSRGNTCSEPQSSAARIAINDRSCPQ